MTPQAPAAPSTRRRTYWHWQTLLALTVLIAAGYLAHRHRAVLASGAGRLAVADHGWLLVGATAVTATWVCSALAQQGA
ncbi:TIGR00374 family protein, partial [Streptomyces sp. NPDC052676]